MLRRWIIRSIFLTLLLLCLTAWPASHFWRLNLVYNRDIHGCSLEVAPGQLRLAWIQSRFSTQRRFANITPVDPSEPEFVDTSGRNFLGFGAGIFPTYWKTETVGIPILSGLPSLRRLFDTYTQHFIRIPFWFLTTASALLFLLIWRKTTRPDPSRAFPIEPTTPTSTQK